MTYPDGEVVNSTYRKQMAVNAMTGTNTYVQSTTYDAAGRPLQRQLGSSNTTTYTYKNWDEQVGGALKTITTSAGLQNLTYSCDAAGNISQVVDVYNGQTETLNYDYERLLSTMADPGHPIFYRRKAAVCQCLCTF